MQIYVHFYVIFTHYKSQVDVHDKQRVGGHDKQRAGGQQTTSGGGNKRRAGGLFSLNEVRRMVLLRSDFMRCLRFRYALSILFA